MLTNTLSVLGPGLLLPGCHHKNLIQDSHIRKLWIELWFLPVFHIQKYSLAKMAKAYLHQTHKVCDIYCYHYQI